MWNHLLPQIHQKYIYMWDSSYRIPAEHWQKSSDNQNCKKDDHIAE